MFKLEKAGLSYYVFSNLSRYTGIRHFVSTGDFNIGFTEGTPIGEVIGNRRQLAASVGFDVTCWVMGHQVHSSNVFVVGKEEAGKGALDKESRLADTDALITNRPGICITVLSADCVPVLLYDPVRSVVGAVHAGWRGTVEDIVGKTVRKMEEIFGCRPIDLYAGIGPSIGKCCFEVGNEVAAEFDRVCLGEGIIFPEKNKEKYRVDLWEANRRFLINAGLCPEHIEVAGLCTLCSTENFFSYRRQGTAAGRFGAGIMLC